MFSQFDVGEPDWSARSPELSPIQHLWDEPDHQPRAGPDQPSVSDLTDALMILQLV